MDFADYTETVYYWGQDYIQYNKPGTSNEQEDYVDRLFGKIKQEWVDKGYPVVMGEYGIVTIFWDNGTFYNPLYDKPFEEGKEYFGLFNMRDGMKLNIYTEPIIDGIMEGADTEYPY